MIDFYIVRDGSPRRWLDVCVGIGNSGSEGRSIGSKMSGDIYYGKKVNSLANAHTAACAASDRAKPTAGYPKDSWQLYTIAPETISLPKRSPA